MGDTMIHIQTLLFWTKVHLHENAHPSLKLALNSIFANSRQSSFAPISRLSPPLALLLESFEVYKKQRNLNGDIYASIPPKEILNLNKTILDKTFASLKGIPSKAQIKK